MRFRATHISSYRQAGVLVVGIASDQQNSDGLGVILQRGYGPDAEEGNPTLSGPYLDLGERGRSGYDVVDSSLLTDRSLTLTVRPKAVAKLGGIESIQIELAVGESSFAELREALREIFRDRKHSEGAA